MSPQIGKIAPNIEVSTWVQGEPTNIDKHRGKVLLVEIFQVNCPGCFTYGLPQAIEMHKRYQDQGLSVFGIATAFEDFDKNTLKHLQLLLSKGEVIGETLDHLSRLGLLDNGKLPFSIPFPVAMDLISKMEGNISHIQIRQFIEQQIPDFENQPISFQTQITAKAKEYLSAKKFSAHTFENYELRGTPSSILVDRNGILSNVAFGEDPSLESNIQKLLAEK